MKFLARKITLFFIRKGKIKEEDLEVYEYCFEMLLSTTFNIVILIVGALITKRYYETLIFSIAFIIIRRCIGGYHSKTHFGCLSLLIIMFISMIFLLMINHQILNIISMILSLICLVFISIFAPVSHPNNPIDSSKKDKMNTIAILISASYCLICSITMILIPTLNISILVTLPLTFSTISMVIGHFIYKNISYD